MRLEKTFIYQAPLKSLVGALTSKSYYQKRYHLDDGDDGFTLWQLKDDGLHVQVTKDVPIRVDNLPLVLRKFVAPQMPLRTEFVWQDFNEGLAFNQLVASCRMTLGKAPVEIKGSLILTPEGDEQSKQYWCLDLSCSIPVFGNKLLEKAGPKVLELLEEEHDAVVAFLVSSQVAASV